MSVVIVKDDSTWFKKTYGNKNYFERGNVDTKTKPGEYKKHPKYKEVKKYIEDINKKLKPTVEKELSNIQQLMKKYEITYLDQNDKKNNDKKTKKNIKKVVKATKKK